CSRYRESH
ncbi:acrB/AcrD/AcrF family protein, partial [Escherichia coli 95.0183]